MAVRQIEKISETLTRLATPGLKPKKLLKAVRKEHPQASKKEIARAAFFALIVAADQDPDKAKRLQDFALVERTADDDALGQSG
jgi:hypothetical protein